MATQKEQIEKLKVQLKEANEKLAEYEALKGLELKELTIDENLYPQFHVSVLPMEKLSMAETMPIHERNINAVITNGAYRVLDVSAIDGGRDITLLVSYVRD